MAKMPDKELNQLESIFHSALALKGEERTSYLVSACAGNAVLRREVEDLIAAYETGNGFLDESAVTLAMHVLNAEAAGSMTAKEVGPYKILKTLGRGGMGEVFLAEDSRLGRKVALKFLSGEFIKDNWAKRQLIREAQAVAMLDHPNICHVYGFEEIGEYSFMVMQYVEGETLAEMIGAQSLRADQTITLAKQIVGALAEAHAHGITHRDVKPKNIMVTRGGQVKVLDFGLAKIQNQQGLETGADSISHLSKAGLLVGTIAYMSPEQLRGERLDSRSDIFSFGTVLYEMACGRNPYAHETNAEVISAILSHEPRALKQFAADCPKGLDRIVEKCLRKDREDRYQSASELLIDFDNLDRTRSAPSPYFRVQTAAMVALLLLLLSVITFVYFGLTRSSHTLAMLPIACERANSQCLGATITENLIKDLSRRSDLRVKSSRVEPSLYGSQAISPQKIGRDLNADAVLFGRIREHNHALVLTIRIENVKDGSRIAEEEFSLKPEELSSLQQELSLKTAFYLQLPLSNEERNLFAILAARQNRKPEAFELYFRGRLLWNKRDRENIQKAIDLFTQATEQDPLYAQAYAGLASCYVLMNTVAYGSMPTKEAMIKAEWAAKQALKLDEALPEAHTAWGVVFMRSRWDWENSEKEFKRAIAIDHDFAEAHYWYSNLLAYTGRGTEAIAESKTARDLEPFSPPAIMNYCRTLYKARQIDQADACLAKLATDYPEYDGGKYIRGLVYIQEGKYREATELYEEIYAKKKAYGGAMLGYVYGITNKKTEALRVLAEMQELRDRENLPQQELAVIYLGLNDLDKMFPLLRAAAEEKFPPLVGLLSDPMFDSLRSDPRFIELVKELKLPAQPTTRSSRRFDPFSFHPA